MRESDWLAGRKCGVRGCKCRAEHTRYKIAVFEMVGTVARVEILLCDTHAVLADSNPELFEIPAEKAMRM
jgi:hypothetical protein